MSLLFLAQVVVLWATHADASAGSTGLKAESLEFYYKTDENARYLDLKTRWQSETQAELTYLKVSELAEEAYKSATVESPFDQWRYQGGPAPNIFSGKVHLYNTGKQAWLNVPVQVTLRAKVGALRVNPALQTTDYGYLQQTARWETVSTRTVKIPVIAPGEDIQVEVGRFNLPSFLAKRANQWPAEVEFQITAPQVGQLSKSIPLIPDHFVVPVLY